MIEYSKAKHFYYFVSCLKLYQKMELQFQKLGKPNGNHVMFDIYLKIK